MPWKETCPMDEKLSFIAECLRGEFPMVALCEDYGISRKTGYKWLGRYRERGAAGLVERPRAPRCHGRSMAPALAEAIIALRRARPHWGPRKLRAVLMGEQLDKVWPAASTMGDLLRAEGLVSARRRRIAAPSRTLRPANGPNDVWCIDFKGWFRTRDGERCDPLTVTDAYSRYLLACVILPPRTEEVRVAVEQLFERYGLPETIRSDNGSPFAGTGAGGLSRLSVGWLKAGIALERIDPGQPQQNGRHERMHKTLATETTRPPAASMERQQDRFDRFRQDFNANRPHEALGQQPPASFYRPSPRAYPERLQEPWYDAWHAMRRVRTDGSIKWGGDLVFISSPLAGEPVGIAETDSGDWIVRFADIDLGIRSPDEKTSWLPGGPAGPPGSATNREHCYPCNRSIVLPIYPVAQRDGRLCRASPAAPAGAEAAPHPASPASGRGVCRRQSA